MNTAEADTFKKALEPTLVTDDGMVMEVSVEHPENALEPILTTEDGIDMEVSAEQPENADAPILVTDDGIDMEVRPVHPANALSRMDLTANVNGPNVTVLGMVIAPEATAAAVLDTETEAVSWSTMRYTTLLAVRVTYRLVGAMAVVVQISALELSVYRLVGPPPLNEVLLTVVLTYVMLLVAYKFVITNKRKLLSPSDVVVSGITRFVILP